ncbi:MAG: type VI secretion system Vgr family protein [Gemmataceae bacterium]
MATGPGPMVVTTPLGKDVFSLVGFMGQEAISQPFHYQLDVTADNSKEVAFDKLLGQKVAVQIDWAGGKKRFFGGICSRITQGASDNLSTSYRMELVPQIGLLSRRAQSRVFQHISVPDILKKVLKGLDVSFELQGTFEPRDYCVQYRETDLNFACRIMEEEGIFYFFKHGADGPKMVVANTGGSHGDLPDMSKVTYDSMVGGFREQGGVTNWEKMQELRAGKWTLRDYNFELPKQNLEAQKTIIESLAVGQVTHKLKVGGNDQLEIYDWPGEYSQRFDGIDKGGGEQPAELQKVFADSKRTVEIRMQQDALSSLTIQGAGNCANFTPGFKFTLTVLPDDKRGKLLKAEGSYVLTSVTHVGQVSESGEGYYHNSFTCIPVALPYRPARSTAKPVIQGTQTAVVVGPAGEEIFTDKYGRVKVQFPWDREGKNDADSSCWIRVGTPWAGKQWGMIHIPRIGQEVIVDFLEGDPDQPIIVGSVYNAEQMPPYALPTNKTQSGLKTRSTLKGDPSNFNELRFEDKKGSEDIFFHAEKDFHREVENDDSLKVDHDQTIEIKNNRTATVKEGDEQLTVQKGNRSIEVTQGNDSHTIKQGNRAVEISMGNDSLMIKMGNQTTKLDLGKSETEAMQSIELKVGQSSIKLDQTGVSISGLMIKIEGQVQTQLKGLMTQVNADAMLKMGGAITMIG